LGEGGMGAVYLAEQIAVGNRPVALKVLSRKLLDDPNFLLRFQNEAASTGRIHHANVVTIYESGQADDGTPYIAMEFLEGESLRQALARRGALPVPEVAEILQQAARGLNAAHKLGIIHRDLKPDNIFLTYPDDESVARVSPPAQTVPPASPPAPAVGAPLVGALPIGNADQGRAQGPPLRPVVVKIVDFGIAKLRESGAHTQTGMVLGTPAYMSFEQASGMRSDELDARSDVYSLGVVVYEMLTGRVPFHSDTPLGYLRKHMMEEPPPFRALAPGLGVPSAVEGAVMKALAKDRDQRFTSALEFAREFSRVASAQAPPEDLRPTVKVVSPDRTRAEQERQARGQAEAERRDKERAEAERLARKQAEAKQGGAEEPHVVPKPRRRARYVILGLIGFAVIVAGAWFGRLAPYISQERLERQHLAERQTTIERSGPAAAGAKVNSKDGLKYVWIPPGTFLMGCSPGDNECAGDEKPAHQVTITKGFWIGQTPVTVGGYKRFAGATGRQVPPPPYFNSGWANENMPIVNVTWDDAQAYCGWAGGRLLTEAEWEYAARGGSTEARYGPLDEVAWYSQNSGGQTRDVAQKRANGFGLYDVLGNVWEWVNDWYDQNYHQNSPSQDPTGPRSGTLRVLRGGSWGFAPRDVRVSFRVGDKPADRGDVGFRCSGEVFAP
jgi:serine/threonine-protein kinase